MKRYRDKSSTAASRRGYAQKRDGSYVKLGPKAKPFRSMRAKENFEGDPVRLSESGERMARSRNADTRAKGIRRMDDAEDRARRANSTYSWFQTKQFSFKKVKIKRADGVTQTYRVSKGWRKGK